MVSYRNRNMRDYFEDNDGSGRNPTRSLGFFGRGGSPIESKRRSLMDLTPEEYNAEVYRRLHPNGAYRRRR